MKNMDKAGVLCVVKHFPGSAGTDPHYTASVINTDIHTLNSYIWPFRVLINNGARAIMAAHTSVPIIDERIASLSPVVMQNWLRDELGFDGLIISDEFVMVAAGNMRPDIAAVHSLAAGSDMILVWQGDLRRTHTTIVAALQDGSLSRDRLNDAVQRILYEKIKMGLIQIPESREQRAINNE
jgi:beta-glucosidase-like glycosyl hydrolase